MSNGLMTPSRFRHGSMPHYLSLRSGVDNPVSSMIRSPRVRIALLQLVTDKGLAHERDCLEEYRRRGLSILEVSQRREHERFSTRSSSRQPSRPEVSRCALSDAVHSRRHRASRTSSFEFGTPDGGGFA